MKWHFIELDEIFFFLNHLKESAISHIGKLEITEEDKIKGKNESVSL